MIDPNLLNILKSNLNDPSYSVIIQDFQQPKFCNKDRLQMVVQQVNPNLFKIIEVKNNIIEKLMNALNDNDIEIPDFYDLSINNIVEKTLTIDSTFDYNLTNELFTSGITGTISHEEVKELPSTQLETIIKNKHINITTNDSPLLLTANQFNITKNKITIDIPKNIAKIEVIVSHKNLNIEYKNEMISIPVDSITYNEIENNQIIININDFIDNLLNCDILQSITNDINLIDEHIMELNAELIIDDDLTEEQQQYNANINARIQELEDSKTELKNKQNIIENKIKSLNFSDSIPFNLNIEYHTENDLTSKGIECINCELQTSIDIDFINKYKNLPNVILTIDNHNKIYSSYELEFKTDTNNNYSGVIINFKNMKKIRTPIEISIVIIGDKIV